MRQIYTRREPNCKNCGETDPIKFRVNYVSLCKKCARIRDQETAKNRIPRKRPNTKEPQAPKSRKRLVVERKKRLKEQSTPEGREKIRRRVNIKYKKHMENLSPRGRMKQRLRCDAYNVLGRKRIDFSQKEMEVLFHIRLFKLVYGQTISLEYAQEMIRSFSLNKEESLLQLYSYKVRNNLLGRLKWTPNVRRA